MLESITNQYATSSSPVGIRSSSPAFLSTKLDAFNEPSSPISTFTPTNPAAAANHAAKHFGNNNNNNNITTPVSISPLHSTTAAAVTATSATTAATPLIFEADLRVTIPSNSFVKFGRKITTKSYPHPSSSSSAAAAETTIPILLPRAAKHASRLHCTVRWIGGASNNNNLEIKVLGQNGMHIQGKRYGKDRTVTIPVVRSCQDINLGFWGWNCVISPEVEFDEIEEMEEEVEMEQLGMSLSDETSSELDMPSRSSINPGRLSSPALSVLSALSSSPPRDTSPLRTSTRATALATHLHLDLPGLIASAIVFHPRSTVGVEEVVKALLREIGGMWDILEGGKTGLVTNQESEQEREELAVDEWWDLVESVLREEEMFGVIENVGLRDAAGNVLPPAYYYMPESDTSVSRVEALEPFVKRVRGARVAAGGTRYFWRRPAIKRRS